MERVSINVVPLELDRLTFVSSYFKNNDFDFNVVCRAYFRFRINSLLGIEASENLKIAKQL